VASSVIPVTLVAPRAGRVRFAWIMGYRVAKGIRDPVSRQRTDELLAGLRAGGWRPRAWARFLARSACLSCEAAAARPRAAAEVTALHAVLFGLTRVARPARASGSRQQAGRCRGRAWVTVSWLLAITHLGLLGERRSLGLANVLTLARACLPALGPGRWSAAAAVASDLLDGRLARGRGEVTAFGAYADSLADTAFWTWFAARYEPSRVLRAAVLATWAAPAAAVTGASLARGRMAEAPRPAVIRPAAALAAVLAARAVRRHRAALMSAPARLPGIGSAGRPGGACQVADSVLAGRV
jgi:hypothetical protein